MGGSAIEVFGGPSEIPPGTYDPYGYAAAALNARAIYVASSTATATEKILAGSYVATGSNDDIIINEAITAAGGGGSVILSSGEFIIGSPIILNQYGGLLTGVSPWNGDALSSSTPLTGIYLADGSDCDMISVQALKCNVRDLFLFGNKANNTSDNISPTYSDASTTNGSPTLISASACFCLQDIGKTVTGIGIPSDTTIIAVQRTFSSSHTTATLSNNATATASNITITVVDRFTSGHGISHLPITSSLSNTQSGDLRVRDCYIFQCAANGIEIWSNFCDLTRVCCENNAGNGLHVSGSALGVTADGMIYANNTGLGLLDDSVAINTDESGGNYAGNNAYIGCRSFGNSGIGIQLNAGYGKALSGCYSEGNSDVDQIKLSGALVGAVVQGSRVNNCSCGSASTYAGIRLDEDASSNYPSACIITGNTIYNTGVVDPEYGIIEAGSGSAGNIISNNTISGVVVPASVSNPATILQNNIGVVFSQPVVGPSAQYNDLIGVTLDPAAATATHILTAAATLFLGRIPVTAPVKITNVLVELTTLGNTLTNSFVAVYNSAGTLIGQSTDQSTEWETGSSTGLKTIALSGGPFTYVPISSDDFLWAAIYVGVATTLPTFEQGEPNSSLINAGCTVARSRFATYAVANTSTLPSITPTSLTQDGLAFWLGLS